MSDENKNPKGNERNNNPRPQEKPQTGERINLNVPGESTAQQEGLNKAFEIPQRPSTKPKSNDK